MSKEGNEASIFRVLQGDSFFYKPLKGLQREVDIRNELVNLRGGWEGALSVSVSSPFSTSITTSSRTPCLPLPTSLLSRCPLVLQVTHLAGTRKPSRRLRLLVSSVRPSVRAATSSCIIDLLRLCSQPHLYTKEQSESYRGTCTGTGDESVPQLTNSPCWVIDVVSLQPGKKSGFGTASAHGYGNLQWSWSSDGVQTELVLTESILHGLRAAIVMAIFDRYVESP
jgi:hypothetical protein